MFEAVQGLLDEHAALERELRDPQVLADQTRARKAGRRGPRCSIVHDLHPKEKPGPPHVSNCRVASL